MASLNTYLLAGGDGFSAFTATTSPATWAIDVDALVAHLKAQSAPLAAPVEGRITSVP